VEPGSTACTWITAIIEAHAILDVEKYRQSCEIIPPLRFHHSIEATAETPDIATRPSMAPSPKCPAMRKYKPGLTRATDALSRDEVRTFDEASPLRPTDFDPREEPQPTLVQNGATVSPCSSTKPSKQMEMSQRQFVVFLHAKTQRIIISPPQRRAVRRDGVRRSSNYGENGQPGDVKPGLLRPSNVKEFRCTSIFATATCKMSKLRARACAGAFAQASRHSETREPPINLAVLHPIPPIKCS